MRLMIGLFLGAAIQWRQSVGIGGELADVEYAEAMVELSKNWGARRT